MNPMKRLILLVVFVLATVSAKSQGVFNIVRENPVYKPSFGGHIGTSGLGLDVFHPLGNRFGAQLGVTLMPFHTKIIGYYGDHETKSRAKARMHNAHLLFGWLPFYGARTGIRRLTINVGTGYFFHAEGTGYTTLANDYYYGEIEVLPRDVGTLYTTVNWAKAFAPYAGLSMGDISIDERFGFNFAVGAYMLSQPRVDMHGTNLLTENEHNEPIVERNIRNYRYLPNIQVGLTYRFQPGY